MSNIAQGPPTGPFVIQGDDHDQEDPETNETGQTSGQNCQTGPCCATGRTRKKRTKPAKPAAKGYIIFGADEYAKPKAARFSAEAPDLLAKAAAAMHLRLAEVTEDLAEIATKLPAGRLHANGRGLVPYVKGDLYAELVGETVGDQETPANPNPSAQDLPRSWDEIQPGHLVIARETLECGWCEAIV
jgi:hypothetical protein